MSDGAKLYRTIVGYGFALAATVETGAACSGPRRGPMREGPPPMYCEVNDCAVHGTIVDEHGKPVAGATIEYAGQTTTSDAAGVWTFPPSRSGMIAPASENANTITAKTAGGRVVTQEYTGADSHRYGPSTINLVFPPLPPVPPPPAP